MPTISELQQKRGKLYKQAEEILQSDERTAEENERVDTLFSEMDSLKEQIDKETDRRDTMRRIESELDAKEERIYRETGERQDIEPIEERHQRAFDHYIRGRVTEEDREFFASREYRALATQTVGTSGQGGVTVPTDFRAQLIEAMKAFGGMRRSRATQIDTDNGRNLTVPTSDDTSNVATIVGEATAITASTHVPFSAVTLEATKYKSGPIKISSELAQDSALNIEAIVRNAMATRFGRGTEPHFATRSSTETSGPHGVINASTGAVSIVKTAYSSTNPAGVQNALINLQHSVDPAYRDQAEWMFNDATFKVLRQLKDADNRLIWQAGLSAGADDTLLGDRYIINQHFPSGTTNTAPQKFIAYGDFSHYWIRDVRPMAIRRLNERYAEEDVFALLGFMRVDGRPVIASASGEEPIQWLVSTTN